MTNIAVIILLNLVFYFKTLKFGYVSDDTDVPKDKPNGIWNKIKALALCNHLWNSELHHFISILVHTIVCVLIYLAFGSNSISFWAAIFFSINPASLMAGVQLTNRHYAVTTLILLLGLCIKPLFPALYIATSFFGFNAAFTPLFFLRTHYWYFLFLIPIWGIIKYRMVGKSWFGIKYDKSSSSRTLQRWHWDKLIIGFKTFGYYTRFLLFPLKRGMYHDFLYTYGVKKEDNEPWLRLNWSFWFGLGLMYVFITNIAFNPSVISTALWWYLCLIILWCNFQPMINQPFAERYAYLALTGLMVALSAAIHSIHYPDIRLALLSSIFTFYALRSWIDIGAFKDNMKYLEYNVYDFNFPNQYFAWTIKGEYELINLQDWAKSLDSFRNAYLSRKKCSRINFRLAHLLGTLGRFEEALYHFQIAYDNPMEGFEDMRSDIAVVTLKKQLEEGLARKKNAG